MVAGRRPGRLRAGPPRAPAPLRGRLRRPQPAPAELPRPRRPRAGLVGARPDRLRAPQPAPRAGPLGHGRAGAGPAPPDAGQGRRGVARVVARRAAPGLRARSGRPRRARRHGRRRAPRAAPDPRRRRGLARMVARRPADRLLRRPARAPPGLRPAPRAAGRSASSRADGPTRSPPPGSPPAATRSSPRPATSRATPPTATSAAASAAPATATSSRPPTSCSGSTSRPCSCSATRSTPTGRYSDFLAGYGPSWGRLKGLTRPVPGNHEYGTPGAAGYFDYFDGVGKATGVAGGRDRGYYSFDVGTWHVVALNSNCGFLPGGCAAGSPQEQWLRADLAAHPRRARSPSGTTRSSPPPRRARRPATRPLWQALYDAGADVVLNGHAHAYERFAPQTADAAADPARGIREFVVGTGGRNLQGFRAIRPNSEVRSRGSYGVLAMTLHPTGYDWRFLPALGRGQLHRPRDRRLPLRTGARPRGGTPPRGGAATLPRCPREVTRDLTAKDAQMAGTTPGRPTIARVRRTGRARLRLSGDAPGAAGAALVLRERDSGEERRVELAPEGDAARGPRPHPPVAAELLARGVGRRRRGRRRAHAARGQPRRRVAGVDARPRRRGWPAASARPRAGTAPPASSSPCARCRRSSTSRWAPTGPSSSRGGSSTRGRPRWSLRSRLVEEDVSVPAQRDGERFRAEVDARRLVRATLGHEEVWDAFVAVEGLRGEARAGLPARPPPALPGAAPAPRARGARGAPLRHARRQPQRPLRARGRGRRPRAAGLARRGPAAPAPGPAPRRPRAARPPRRGLRRARPAFPPPRARRRPAPGRG